LASNSKQKGRWRTSGFSLGRECSEGSVNPTTAVQYRRHRFIQI